jgi:hypothetical protein
MPGTARPVPGASPGQESVHAGIVKAAAHKWNIPDTILWGVYGTETAFGSAVRTSSAGAVGSFQFEPSTASTYGYPVTNATDPKTFAAQADAAAHYLSDLFHQTGSWSSALSAYNAGPAGGPQPGYVAQVNANGGGINAIQISNSTWVAIATALGIALPIAGAAIGPEAIAAGLAGEGSAAGTAASTAAGVAGKTLGVAAIASLLTSTDFWLRLGEGLLGVLLLYLGLHALTGQSSSVGQQAKHVTRIIPLPV